ncbi:MAG: sporulation integral membrane protein YlbJ [Acetivibrionales bacterium]
MTVLFIFCLIIFSRTCVDAASRGLNLWLNVVFPSLFPFFIASELLKGSNLFNAFGVLLEPLMYPLFKVPGSGALAFLMGTTSGYPVGAKITSSLRKEKHLSKIQAERLIAFSNNSGPLFIAGAVATGMFNSPQLGPFLLACHITASITVGIIFRFYGIKKNSYVPSRSKGRLLKKFSMELSAAGNAKSAFGSLLGEAIRNSIMTILTIGGFIILFSVIISILLETGFITTTAAFLSFLLAPLGLSPEVLTSLISGFFEIITGIKMICSASNVDLIQRLISTSTIIGWAGLSVHFQVLSIIRDTDINPAPYIVGKLIHGVIAGVYTFIGILIAGPDILKSVPAFSQHNLSLILDWQHSVMVSIKYFIFTALFFIVAAAAAKIIDFLFGSRAVCSRKKNLF